MEMVADDGSVCGWVPSAVMLFRVVLQWGCDAMLRDDLLSARWEMTDDKKLGCLVAPAEFWTLCDLANRHTHHEGEVTAAIFSHQAPVGIHPIPSRQQKAGRMRHLPPNTWLTVTVPVTVTITQSKVVKFFLCEHDE